MRNFNNFFATEKLCCNLQVKTVKFSEPVLLLNSCELFLYHPLFLKIRQRALMFSYIIVKWFLTSIIKKYNILTQYRWSPNYAFFTTADPTIAFFGLCTHKWGIFALAGDPLQSH